jgi:hypothetical protein
VGLAWRDPVSRQVAELQATAAPAGGEAAGEGLRRGIVASVIAGLLLAAPVATQAQDDPEHVLDPRMVTTAMRRYRGEPSAERVVRSAVRAGAVDPLRARRVADRARAAGWVPWLRVTARRGQARDLQIETDATGIDVSTDDELSAEATLTFRLDRLVFAPEEVPLLREERARAEARHELIRAVLHVYFERRRLQLERDLLGRGGIEIEARIAEAEGLLDAFTGGRFSRMMRPP